MRRTMAPVLGLALALATPVMAAETWVADSAHSEITFRVRHMMISKVSGRFREFGATLQLDPAKPEASSIEVKVKTASIDTNQPDRDKHLRSGDFFETEKFPEMTFKSSKIVGTSKDHFDVTGTLTLRGVSKEITVPVAFSGFIKDSRGGEHGGFEAAFTVNRKEFGLVYNSPLETGGVMIGEDVEVSLMMEIKKKPAA